MGDIHDDPSLGLAKFTWKIILVGLEI